MEGTLGKSQLLVPYGSWSSISTNVQTIQYVCVNCSGVSDSLGPHGL